MSSALLSNTELKEKLRISQEAKLRRWLNERRIRFDLDGERKAITTLNQIEKYLERETAEEVDF